MGKKELWQRAAQRWIDRMGLRGTEPPERVQKRLDHLAEVATKATVETRLPASGVALPLVSKIGLERVINKSDFLDINFLENALAVSRSIGRVHIRDAGGHTLGFGTGFLVSPSLLMTNNHVLASAADAAHSVIEFDYQNDRTGRSLPVVSFALEPGRLFITDPGLDFSLVAVRPLSADGIALQRYGWSRLLGMEGKALIGDALNIIQHPRGEVKQLVLRSNELVDVFDNFLHYVTDTEPGSSGAAVFNDQWEIVALHHSGVPATDPQGNLLASNGGLWHDGMGEAALKWVANEGIRVSSLVAHLRALPLAGSQAQLLKELFELVPPAPQELAQQAQVGVGAVLPGGIHSSLQLALGGQTVSLPLTIQLQFGQPVPQAVPVAAPVSAVAAAADADALAELREAAGREYFDKAANESALGTFYNGLALADDPAAAFRQLSALLKGSHSTPLSYNPSRHVYPWVDLQPPRPDKTPWLKSIYSGKAFDPREFIAADREVDRRREQLRQPLRESLALGQELASAEEAFLEAALPYNCEHVVPQSWFGKREPMRGDLHHLFACESGCNSFRGNIPYFDFPDFEEVVRSDCGKRETGRFEPGAGKGVAARATLYFLLRNPGQINATAAEYTADRIDTLLAWHEQFPPTEYERHRNLAIQERQGNRNPLIDFPEWAQRIDFTLGLG
ncbi:endonuclease [Massilia sp. Root351]|uniref:endonuclease n=1 Tax=Massilia sp. Root351 TaxID=1736522 RepID=UPI00070D7145|nr:endonuclease [Massilia sp. Root351]